MEQGKSNLDWDKSRAVLGVSADATDEQVRAAYLLKVRLHPPDRDPEQFELVRDAYAQLKDPRLRVMQVLESPNPFDFLTELVGEQRESKRQFVGIEPWLAILKEKRT